MAFRSKHDAAAVLESLPDPLEEPIITPEPGGVAELAPGIYVLPIAVPFQPGAVNCVAIAETRDGVDGWTIIDTGFIDSKSAWRAHFAGLLAHKPIFRVIATHHHPDHIGLAGWLQSRFGAELWTSRTAWFMARMLYLDQFDAAYEPARAFYRRCGYGGAMLARYEERALFTFKDMIAPLPMGFRRIAEGDEIEIGGRMWSVMFGHGHAPDHVMLYSAEDDLLIAGDQILPKISPNIGVQVTEPEANPMKDWLACCDRFGAELSDESLTVPGHGPVFRGAAKRARVIAERQRAKMERLHTHLKTGPYTVVESFAGVFRRKIAEREEGLATNETLAHLNWLASEGLAERETRVDGVWLWRAR